MPYLFLGLVIINIIVLGYFTFLYEPKPTSSVLEAEENLIAPIDFENTSSSVPPLIGTKD